MDARWSITVLRRAASSVAPGSDPASGVLAALCCAATVVPSYVQQPFSSINYPFPLNRSHLEELYSHEATERLRIAGARARAHLVCQPDAAWQPVAPRPALSAPSVLWNGVSLQFLSCLRGAGLQRFLPTAPVAFLRSASAAAAFGHGWQLERRPSMHAFARGFAAAPTPSPLSIMSRTKVLRRVLGIGAGWFTSEATRKTPFSNFFCFSTCRL